MKKIMTILILSLIITDVSAQDKKYISIALVNTQTDMPFGKFAGMFSRALHPGIEIAKGNNFSVKEKHDWFWELRAGYFFHRFVQHGIPVYANIGYRYKFGQRISADLSAGGGYMHSIPATSKLKLDANGNYKNNKGIGRAQGIANFGIGAGYLLNPAASRPIRLFINYQQRLQMPFVKSYVTVLPYNSFMIGISRPITSNN